MSEIDSQRVPRPRLPRRRGRGLGIQSKLLILLLSVSTGSTIIVGWSVTTRVVTA